MDSSAWQFCVAPMIDVSDRHCRYFHRLLAPQARLYTEMVTTGALLRGQAARHLDYNPSEHPLALQLGGNDPKSLAQCAKLGQHWDYDEINLNCGCPSDRVRQGAFGACLMLNPQLVADCVKAMQDAVDLPISVKHRLGIDYETNYGFVRDFVGTLYEQGCRIFIVHARNAVLQGLSPKENRQIPPLRYEFAARLKVDFPQAVIVLNGGLAQVDACVAQLQTFDGVMLGRAAWHHPAVLKKLQVALDPSAQVLDDQSIFAQLERYIQAEHAQGTPLQILLRGVLGWQSGTAGARIWRRMLSDPQLLRTHGADVLRLAWQALAH